ncbi:unnamed protein product, partial [Urochloa humidicola]
SPFVFPFPLIPIAKDGGSWDLTRHHRPWTDPRSSPPPARDSSASATKGPRGARLPPAMDARAELALADHGRPWVARSGRGSRPRGPRPRRPWRPLLAMDGRAELAPAVDLDRVELTPADHGRPARSSLLPARSTTSSVSFGEVRDDAEPSRRTTDERVQLSAPSLAKAGAWSGWRRGHY